MDRHKIFIIGDSLFANGIIAVMRRVDTMRVIGMVPSLEAAASWLSRNQPDVIIVVGITGEDSGKDFGSLVAHFPHLPIIWTTLTTDKIQITTSQCVDAHMAGLLEVIAALPKHR